MILPRTIALAVLLPLPCLVGLQAARAQTISVGMTPAAFENLSARLALEGGQADIIDRRTCPDFNAALLDGAGRSLVEAVIVCNAVFRAKIADKIKLVHHLPHSRRLTEIAAGRIDVSASTIFPEGVKNIVTRHEFVLSDAALQVNEFEKVIFTIPARRDVLAVRSLAELRKFKGVTVKFWQVDMKTLEAMKLRGVVGVSKPDAIIKMIKGGRADFTISEFAAETSKPWAQGMVRVPGVKIALVSPRVFLVSPQRRDIVRAINTLLGKSRTGGLDFVRQAYRKSGFFSPETSNWKRLFPVN